MGGVLGSLEEESVGGTAVLWPSLENTVCHDMFISLQLAFTAF